MNALAIHPQTQRRAMQSSRTIDFASQAVIRTSRLTLRKLKPEDQYRIAAAMQDIRVVRMLVSVPVPYASDDALDWIRSWENGDNPGWAYAITFDGGALEGCVTIEWREAGSRSGWHIGYWLMPDHWGEGFISEAVGALIERFFRQMMGETLFAGAIADNPASLKVQDKLGFQVTGMGQVYSHSRGAMVDVIETEVTFGSFMPV
jgi:RimJ/RimL family protein N-acetyltransferase